ncbi:MAG: universal stress protein [Bacteroidia bacterium]|nr:MAG: universal stress protein [Bacteroidia bacterium]
MIKHAILATDLSPAGDLLMDCVTEYKKLGVEKITLLHIPAISFNYMEYSGYSMRVHIEARMLNLQNKLTEAGIESGFVFREGLPSQVIVDYAKEHPGALIIIGSNGHGARKRNLIGSTTQRVIQHSHNPVLMMRIRTTTGEMEMPVCSLESKTITDHAILLTDFSKHAGNVFEYARKHLVANLRSVSLMHVQDSVVMRHRTPEEIENFNQIDTQRLNECTRDLRSKTDAPVKCILNTGVVVPEILREIKLSGASLIVLATHGKGFFSDVVCGSTASALAQLAPTNCLFVPYVNGS